jgi:hypothetical protein
MKSVILRFAVCFGAIALIPNGVPAGIAQGQPTQTGPKSDPSALSGFPFTNEILSYSVTGPGGLSLGTGQLSAVGQPSGWNFELALDAGIPGFAVKDTYRSTASGQLCSASLSKDARHGSRSHYETVTFDHATATRHSNYGGPVGGTTKITVPDCARDALTYLFYVRREMGQGRVPPAQQIIFGAAYTIGLTYTGAETVTVGKRPVVTDKVVCHVKGPASDFRFEVYFDRDAARTPVAIRVPLAVGKFSLELVR